MNTKETIEWLIGPGKVETDIKEFATRLESGKPLRVKYGIDPTSPNVHFGHTVPLRILRRFQEMGHEANLIIGDFTASIGDPSGRNESRPAISSDDIAANLRTYLDQIGKFVDISKTKVWHNSTWYYGMTLPKLIKELSFVTVQQITVRNDFADRLKSCSPIYMHELLYPLIQAMDSRSIVADVELGGTEQLFTLMLARDLQSRANQIPQTCITVPILCGTDGNRRMGKSLGNFVGVSESPKEIFGKTMSIPDTLIEQWRMLLVDGAEVPGENPRDRKMFLAKSLVRQAHGKEAGDEAEREWNHIFSGKNDPEDIPGVEISGDEMGILDLLLALGLSKTRSEARRAVFPNLSVTIGKLRERIQDPNRVVRIEDGLVVRIGKRNLRKIVKK